MASAAPSAPPPPSASNIDDLLQCPICLDILRDPKVLDCQHTFCASCLQAHQNATSRTLGTRNHIDCPTCRTRSNLINNSIDSLPGNYIVRDIIERQYGATPPHRPPGYGQQIQDRMQQMKKEEEEIDWEKYVKPAAAALLGVLGGILLAKGVKKMTDNHKK